MPCKPYAASIGPQYKNESTSAKIPAPAIQYEALRSVKKYTIIIDDMNKKPNITAAIICEISMPATTMPPGMAQRQSFLIINKAYKAGIYKVTANDCEKMK